MKKVTPGSKVSWKKETDQTKYKSIYKKIIYIYINLINVKKIINLIKRKEKKNERI